MAPKFFVLILFIWCGCLTAGAQSPIEGRQYPQNFFRYPLDLPPSTAGSFGELRGAHFHSGLDFKTNQTTGYPVHAVADGYISRLRVQFGGFGNAIYITHPNGYTTVYGHLERYTPAMAKIIKDYQYEHQTFEADIKLPPTELMVCKDDIIAWSGNAGASAGPHLHFEIRDTQTEETINPQLFGLLISDKVPPTITGISIYHMDGSPFSETTPRQFLGVTGSNGNYHLTKPQVLDLQGEIGFGIAATDMNSVSPNHNGIYSIELKLDGKTVYTFAVERFAFDQTHAINAYVDYPELVKSKRYYQKCFILPGSRISLYPQSINRGLITFNDDAVHDVSYVVKDVMGNSSILNVKVKSAIPLNNVAVLKTAGNLFRYDKKNEFSNGQVRVTILPGNLYDDLNFIYAVSAKRQGAYSLTHSIHNRYTPVHDSYDLWIKPDSTIGKYTGKAVIVSTDGACVGGSYQDGYIKAQAHTFGDFFIRVDTVAPVITPLNISNGARMNGLRRISFAIRDNLSGIKTYAGKIDDKWVLTQWDYKTKVLSYTFGDDITPGKHNFDLTVTDNKNNIANFKADFYR